MIEKIRLVSRILNNFIEFQGFWGQSPANSTTELTTEKDSSVVLNCPFDSVPEADIAWNFANGTKIDFNKTDRRVLIVISPFSYQ